MQETTTRIGRLLAEYAALAETLGFFLVTFLLLYAIGRLLVEPIARYWMDFRRTDPTLRRGIQRVVTAGVLAVSILVALSVAGFDYPLRRSAILVAALTVALGFAAQDVIGNLVSGAFIVTSPTFNIGDWIQWNDQEGVIEDISFRATRVRTFDNEIVTVPNSVLTTTAVTNPVLNDTLRLDVPVEINYDDDLDEAIRIMAAEAETHPDVLEEPPPTVLTTDLGEAIRLSAKLWIADPDRIAYGRVRSEYARAVVDRFDEAGIDLGAATTADLSGELGVVSKRDPDLERDE